MEIILLQTVPNLGEIGDVVRVKSGYARNYLVPGGMAQRVTPRALAELEQRRQELGKVKTREREQAGERARDLQGLSITIAKLAGEEGKLYGSVSPQDVAAALAEHGHEVAAREVRLPDNLLKQTGEYTVQLVLHAELSVELALSVIAQETPPS